MKKRTVGQWLDKYLLGQLTGQGKESNKIILFRLAFLAGVLLIIFLTATLLKK